MERLIDRDGLKRYAVLRHSDGRVVVVDGFKKRYDHMRNRIFAFADQMEKIVKCQMAVFFKHITLTYDVLGTIVDASEWKPNDLRNFQIEFFAWLKKRLPGVRIYGHAWAGEIQPKSTHYHFELMIVTDKRLWLENEAVSRIWGHGFVYLEDAETVYYLCSYLKKQDQKNFWYFPVGARCFAVVVKHDVIVDGQALYLVLRLRFLKDWQYRYLADNSAAGTLNFGILKDARSPPSDWHYVKSWTENDHQWFEAKGVTLEEAGKILYPGRAWVQGD